MANGFKVYQAIFLTTFIDGFTKHTSLEVAVSAQRWSRLRGVELPTQVQATLPIDAWLERGR